MKSYSAFRISLFLLALTTICPPSTVAQTYTAPVPPPTTKIKMVRGKTETVTSSSYVIVGVAPKGSKVWVNKHEVKVFKTGSFGYEAKLKPGANKFEVESELNDKKEHLSFTVNYDNRPKSFPPVGLSPESVRLFPEGRNLWIMEGEPLQVSVVTKAGTQVSWFNGTPLFELTELSNRSRAEIGPGRSIYQGVHILNRTDMAEEPADATDAKNVTNSGNATDAKNITNSGNTTDAKNITNSGNATDAKNITNSGNATDAKNITNSGNATDKKLVIAIREGEDTRMHPLTETVRVLTPDRPVTVQTRNGAYLNEGWGGDRLGGSKINMLDSGICMQVIGKIDALFKVRLGTNHSAYIPESVVEVLPDGYYAPTSLSGAWTVSRSGKFDVINIPLPARHPYTIYQEAEPNRLVVDLYGVVCNSNWITHGINLKEIKRVDLRQVAPEVLRFIIDLHDKSPWGYKVEYSGNNLTIKIKHKPDLSKVAEGDWSGLTFAVDAGHGGEESKGAVGPSGYIEQHQNLAMSYMLKEILEKRGAKVVLTRPRNKNVSMDDRKKVVNDNSADLLISIHCNAGGNPLKVGGSSTYYKHIGYRPLSTAILTRLLELPVQNFGNIGHFNFSLNAVTECPNALVETLFISSLADEELLADPAFQRKMMEKVAQGVEDFLRNNL